MGRKWGGGGAIKRRQGLGRAFKSWCFVSCLISPERRQGIGQIKLEGITVIRETGAVLWRSVLLVVSEGLSALCLLAPEVPCIRSVGDGECLSLFRNCGIYHWLSVANSSWFRSWNKELKGCAVKTSWQAISISEEEHVHSFCRDTMKQPIDVNSPNKSVKHALSWTKNPSVVLLNAQQWLFGTCLPTCGSPLGLSAVNNLKYACFLQISAEVICNQVPSFLLPGLPQAKPLHCYSR